MNSFKGSSHISLDRFIMYSISTRCVPTLAIPAIYLFSPLRRSDKTARETPIEMRKLTSRTYHYCLRYVGGVCDQPEVLGMPGFLIRNVEFVVYSL